MKDKAIVVALQDANAKERAVLAAFNASVENIRSRTMSARAANRLLHKAKDEYVVACRALHVAINAVYEKPTGPIKTPNRDE